MTPQATKFVDCVDTNLRILKDNMFRVIYSYVPLDWPIARSEVKPQLSSEMCLIFWLVRFAARLRGGDV